MSNSFESNFHIPFPESIQSSLHTLGFADGVAPSSIKELNKRYHLLALKHHPDKVVGDGDGGGDDGHNEATERFKEINEAHKRVKDYFFSDDNGSMPDIHMESGGYDSILKMFIQSILVKMTAGNSGGSSDNNANAIQSLIHMIITKGIQSGITMFRTMDKNSCITIYEILSKNQDLFGISREIMDELTSIVEEKTGEDLVVRLNPSLLDMLLDRVYILHECGQVYYIPLWHTELHFNKPIFDYNKENNNGAGAGGGSGTGAGAGSGAETSNDYSEVIVLCEPELPNNVSIDDNNNLYISLDVDIQELFTKQILPVYLNEESRARGFIYYLHASDVTLHSKGRQCILLRNLAGAGAGGIARCNTNTSDIYKVGIRANVYANVRLMVVV